MVRLRNISIRPKNSDCVGIQGAMNFSVTHHVKGRPHRTAVQSFVVLLVAFAFALQSFVTQTHLHRVTPELGGGIVQLVHTGQAGGSVPSDTNPLDCPYCQAVAHSGVFYQPPPPLLLLPAMQSEAAMFPAALLSSTKAGAINWRSRAPPTL